MMMIPPVYTCITTVICFQPRSTIIYKRRQLCSLLKLAMASSETGIENLSREDLLRKCQELITSNETLKKELSTMKQSINGGKSKLRMKKKETNQRVLDFTKYRKRRLAFRFLYLGWDYQGFASQENTTNTIEEELFVAFSKAKLIEDRSSANYSRCGRTDKGVSAFGQVIALDVRSNKKLDEEEKEEEELKYNTETRDNEIPYVKALNRILPPDIRMVAYTDVDKDFDARFSCRTRTYKYFFPVGQLDVEIMHEAAQKLVGEKDFRNFCKVDVGNNVNHFIRNVVSFKVRRLQNSPSCYDICEMEITGLAFLWHQVRCMAGVLFLVGMRLEKPEVIDFLLDIEKCPKRPQYGIASEIPLVLYDCHFDHVQWKYEKDFNEQNIHRLQQLWTQKSVQAAALQTMMEDMKKHTPENEFSISSLIPGFTSHKEYKPLHKRSVCEGLDRHLEKQAAKRLKLEEKYATSKKEETIADVS